MSCCCMELNFLLVGAVPQQSLLICCIWGLLWVICMAHHHASHTQDDCENKSAGHGWVAIWPLLSCTAVIPWLIALGASIQQLLLFGHHRLVRACWQLVQQAADLRTGLPVAGQATVERVDAEQPTRRVTQKTAPRADC